MLFTAPTARRLVSTLTSRGGRKALRRCPDLSRSASCDFALQSSSRCSSGNLIASGDRRIPGLGIPARGGIAQTGAEASRRACGRYSDPSHAAAYAHGCAILRRNRNHWRSGDAPKCRRRATCNRGQYRSPTPNAPLRKEVEREADDPEGNLVIVERVVHENQRRFPDWEHGWGGTAHILTSTQDGSGAKRAKRS